MTTFESNPAPVLDTLRLSDHVLSRMLQHLAGSSAHFDHELPQAHNFAALPRAIARVHNPSTGEWVSYLVRPHAIHPAGCAFLLGTFLYPSVRCGLLLRKKDGAALQVFGSVRASPHVAGRVHDVRIAFDSALELFDIQLPADLRPASLLRHHA